AQFCRLRGANMGCEPRRLPSIGPRRGTTSSAWVGGKYVASRLLATIGLVAAVTAPAQAQVKFWGNPFAPSDWSNFFNWVPFGAPTAANPAVISNGGTALVTTSNAVAGSLTLGLSPFTSGTVNIGAGGVLTATGAA